MARPTKRRILIAGGGFGGIYAALELERRLKARDEVDGSIVNRDNFFLCTPMLHEVAASDLDVTQRVALDWTLDLVFSKDLVKFHDGVKS